MPTSLIACYAADTSGVDDGAEPISIAVALLERVPEGGYEAIAHFDGLQTPINPITIEATQVHGLRDADVADNHFDLAALDRVMDPAEVILSWKPWFDRRMFDRIRMVARTRPWHTMRAREDLHAPAPMARNGDRSRARARVDHMIECLNVRDHAAPDARIWAEWVLEQPAEDPKPSPPEYILEGNATFERIFHRNLGQAELGAEFSLWTKPEIDFIAAYQRNRGGGGAGLIFHLLKSKNRKLAQYMAKGSGVKGRLVEIDGLRRYVQIDWL